MSPMSADFAEATEWEPASAAKEHKERKGRLRVLRSLRSFAAKISGRILPRVCGRVVGEVVLTGGGDNFTVESTPDSVVTLLNSTPAVAERLTASGSGSTPLQALPPTPLSGGVARASVVTAAALAALFQSIPSVAEAMMAEVTGDPAALVQPAQVYLSGGVEPASVSTVNEVVALLNGTPEVTALIQTTGSGETVVGAGSASLSGGGEQVTLTGTRTYGWDVHGRLAQVSLPGGQVHSYSYDYRTRRIGLQQTASGTDPAKTTAVVFSGGLSLAEYESTTAQATIASPGQSTVRYVRGPDMGGGVGGLLYSRRAQAVKFNLSNGRGDIVAQSDTSGALTWTASYEAYGKRTKETGENLDKQRGNSKDEDPTGLLNEGFRYRDLETGVWLSRDPAGFVDGPNVYAYVKQNPWSKFDALGLSGDRVDPDGFKWSDRDHHVVPREVARDAGWNKEAKEVFDRSKINTKGVGHNNTAHPKYNQEVAAEMADFLKKEGVTDIGSAKNQRELAERMVEHLSKTDNAYIKGFNSAVADGPDAVKSWYNTAGRNMMLKSTGRMASEGGKIVNGIANIGGKGGRLFARGVPVLGGVVVGGLALMGGADMAEAATEVVANSTMVGGFALDATHLREVSSLQKTVIQFNRDPGFYLPESTGNAAADAIGQNRNMLKRLLQGGDD